MLLNWEKGHNGEWLGRGLPYSWLAKVDHAQDNAAFRWLASNGRHTFEGVGFLTLQTAQHDCENTLVRFGVLLNAVKFDERWAKPPLGAFSFVHTAHASILRRHDTRQEARFSSLCDLAAARRSARSGGTWFNGEAGSVCWGVVVEQAVPIDRCIDPSDKVSDFRLCRVQEPADASPDDEIPLSSLPQDVDTLRTMLAASIQKNERLQHLLDSKEELERFRGG